MSFVDRALPPAIRSADRETLRRARLLAGFTLAVVLAGTANFVQFIINFQPLTLFTIALGTAATGLTVAILRWTKSISLAAHWLVGSVWLTCMTTIVTVGGIESPSYFWTVVSTLLAVTLVGRRAASIWLIAGFLQLVIGFLVTRYGSLPHVPDAQHDRALVVACTTAMAGAYFIARFYEQRKQAMLEEVEVARRSAESAHAAARLILDNVGQGLVLVDSNGQLVGTTSKALHDWFGDLGGVSTIYDLFAKIAPQCSDWLAACYADVFLDMMPVEVVLGQLPSKFERAGRHYTIAYRAIEVDGKVVNVLLVLTDATDVVLAERAEEEHRELLVFIRAIGQDRGALLVVLDELRERVARIADGRAGAAVERRELHTLKGSSAMLGLARIARFCHDLEDAAPSGLDDAQRGAVAAHFAEVDRRIAPFLGERGSGIELSAAEHERLLGEALQSGAGSLVELLRGLQDEPTRRRLAVCAREAQSLAARLGKVTPHIDVADHGLRLPAARFGALWSALSHVLRNAIDHGLEDEAERRAAGKPEAGTLTLATRREGNDIVVEIGDDGRGVDWARLKSRAEDLGHPAATREDLVAALFADGLSTRDEVDEISGRGVGLAAARAAIEALGGRVEVESRPSEGARFIFRAPLMAETARAARAA